MTHATATAARDPIARLKDELSSLGKVARQSLKGTAAETVANRLKAELPGAVETRLDALLDRAGLVRKAKLGTNVVIAAAEATAVAPTPAAPVEPAVA